MLEQQTERIKKLNKGIKIIICQIPPIQLKPANENIHAMKSTRIPGTIFAKFPVDLKLRDDGYHMDNSDAGRMTQAVNEKVEETLENASDTSRVSIISNEDSRGTETISDNTEEG